MTSVDMSWAAFDQARGKHPRQKKQTSAEQAQTNPVIPLSPAAQRQVAMIQKKAGLPVTGQLDMQTIAYAKSHYDLNPSGTTAAKSAADKKKAKAKADAKKKASEAKKAAAKKVRDAKAKAAKLKSEKKKTASAAKKAAAKQAAFRKKQAKAREKVANLVSRQKAKDAAKVRARELKVSPKAPTSLRRLPSGKGYTSLSEELTRAMDFAITPGGRVGDASPLARKGYKGKRKLSDYERELAHALMRKGHSKSKAIKMARGIINHAAATGRWGKGKAKAAVVAGAAASIAQRKSFSNEESLVGQELVQTVDLAGHWRHGWIPLDATATAIKMHRRPGSKGFRKRTGTYAVGTPVLIKGSKDRGHVTGHDRTGKVLVQRRGAITAHQPSEVKRLTGHEAASHDFKHGSPTAKPGLPPKLKYSDAPSRLSTDKEARESKVAEAKRAAEHERKNQKFVAPKSGAIDSLSEAELSRIIQGKTSHSTRDVGKARAELRRRIKAAEAKRTAQLMKNSPAWYKR